MHKNVRRPESAVNPPSQLPESGEHEKLDRIEQLVARYAARYSATRHHDTALAVEIVEAIEAAYEALDRALVTATKQSEIAGIEAAVRRLRVASFGFQAIGARRIGGRSVEQARVFFGVA